MHVYMYIHMHICTYIYLRNLLKFIKSYFLNQSIRAYSKQKDLSKDRWK